MNKKILVGVVGVLSVVLVIGGYFYFNNNEGIQKQPEDKHIEKTEENKPKEIIDKNKFMDADEQRVVQDQLLTEELEKKTKQESDSTDPNDIEKTLDDINLDKELGDLDSLDI